MQHCCKKQFIFASTKKNYTNSMYTKKLLYLIVATMLVISFGCDPGEPEPHDHDHEEELITTFTYTLTPTDDTPPVVLYFQDLDGDGGEEPTVSVTSNFKANTTYAGTISLLNEDEDPAHNVSEEVKEEAVEHQFFFSSSLTDIEVTYDDVDENGAPLGLETSLKTGVAGSGTMVVTLIHEPEKTASGVKDGSIDNAGGSTDLQVTFNIVVE